MTALEDGFNEVIKRHEVLRTTFGVKDGEPLQFIHPELKIKLEVTELEHFAGEECEDGLRALASKVSGTSFDLSRLPLLRVSSFKLSESEHVLTINIHHIVADGLSFGLLLDELDTFYRAFTGDGDPRPIDLAGAVCRLRAVAAAATMASEATYASQIGFWQARLGGTLPVLELPVDKPRPALQSFKGAKCFFQYSASAGAGP